ncbi:hypothetical protein VTI74DRAFT_3696 [Chaetomium olivicolor]
MAEQSHLIVFGDQAVPYSAELRRLIGKREDYTLANLLSESYHALRADIAHLPYSQRSQFPASSNLVELLNAHAASTTPNCSLDSALACLHQIASFVSYFNETGKQYPASTSTCLVGSCLGLLAAFAISSSESILDLVELAPDIVVLAFRLGLVVQNKTTSVASGLDGTVSVSYIVAGIDGDSASNLVNSFCQAQSLSPATRIYVSAVGNGNVTVSGPPTQVHDFFSHHPSLKSAKIALNGLFHSSALYDPAHVGSLVESVSDKVHRRVGRLNIISNSERSSTISPGASEQTLEIILSQILLQQMRWDLVTQRAVEISKNSGSPQTAILPFAAGGVQGLATALRESGAADVTVVDTVRSPRSNESNNGADPSNGKVRSKIAIIGFSGRFPEADNNEEFWNLFLAGLDVVRDIPKDRFDPQLYLDPTGKKKNTSGVTKGCFVKRPDLFDSRFFGMSPREAEQADPAQRLALMTAYEAMEMAGFVPDSTPSTQRNRIGVFYGTASDDYREVNAGQNIDTYFVPGGSRAFLPARINYHFRFSGPSFDVDTACSSGLAAVHIACNSLWTGDCDMAIAGGTNILTNPDNWAGLDRAHFLSRTGNCKTFDDGADGYCRAESVATVLLKRLDDAIIDGDPVYGVILGALTNHSAEAVSITRPHSGAQRAIFSRILNSADVDSSEVSYVEMHGTGTQHGDACEMDSVLSVFAPEGSRRQQSLYLGSAKANIGHAESASGITSLIKVLLMMEKNQIPRHVGIKTKINRNFPTDLAQRNVHIAMQTTPWTRPTDAPHGRRAFVNNFGAAGGNSSVLLEEAPAQLLPTTHYRHEQQDPRPLHVVAVSAKSQSALKANIRALVKYLDVHPDTPIGSLSYTTTARRVHHNFRVAVVGKTIGEIRQGLQDAETKEQYAQKGDLPVGFCFTGQGSQYLGMGRKLLDIPQFRSFVVAVDEVVRLQGFEPILPIVDGSCNTPLEKLPPARVQLATTCLQMALGKFWRSLGISPQLVVGHSLGEYAAMNMAGVLSDADTIFLVGTRALLLEEHCRVGTHTMLAVKGSVSKIGPLMASSSDLEICCVNGPEETVIGGPNDKIEAFAASLASLSIRATQLKVQFAFHSAQVEPMLEAFRQSSSNITFRDPSVPLLSPLLGKVVNSASELGTPAVYLSRHCRETVNFLASLQSAKAAGTITDKMVWVELGPHPACSGSLKATLGSSTTRVFPSLRRNEDDWAIFVPSLTALYESGLVINWDDYHSGFKKNLRVLRLPAYQWDLKSHWIPYVYDWCLTKGNPPPQPVECKRCRELDAAPMREVAVKKEPLTASVQDIVEERYSASEASIVARTDVQNPDLAAVLRGHRVNGQPVCSSAVYADMALTLFSRLLEKSPVALDKPGLGVEVSDMVADKSLILSDQPVQLLELKANVQWSTRRASFTVSSIDARTGKITAHHAACTGSFTQKSRWKTEWNRREYLVKSRIAHLRQSVDDDSGESHLVKTGMFYKLFSSLVDYEPSFKGNREVIIRSADLESTAKVRFNTPAGTAEKWAWPPYWLDSLGQITGFTMNANDTLDSKTQVFINHGWENMRILEKLSQDATYQTYVKMQEKEKDGRSYIGDVYIFNSASDEIVAVYEGVTFSAVPRKILEKVLPAPRVAASKAPVIANPTPAYQAAPVTTPAPAVVQQPVSVQKEVPSSKLIPVAQPSKGPDSSAIANKLKTIISEEVGAPVSDVQDNVELADLGVDSLLALTISDRLLEELSVKVDSSLFIDGLKVKDLIQTVAGGSETPELSSSASPTPPGSASPREPINEEPPMPKGTETPLSTLSLSGSESDCYVVDKQDIPSFTVEPPIPCPPATSVLLQGNPSTATKTLWLFPDGSGLATSYLHLPDISPSVAVYGLNSPFVKKDTASMPRCRFEDYITSYMTEMRRRQPHGPYLVGGWSAGGICAYRAAQRFVEEEGEMAEGLVLFDSPNPVGLKKLPTRLYDEFDKRGLFGSAPGRKPPAWLLEHFMGFSSLLDTFAPRPWRKDLKPLKTWIVWAEDGVDKDGSIPVYPGDPVNMLWLIRKREKEALRANGWDALVGKESIMVEVVKEAHHFNLLQKPAVERVSRFVARAVSC